MKSYRKGSHSLFDLKIHVAWITKYRKPVLSGEVGEGLRDIIRRICEEQEGEHKNVGAMGSGLSIDAVAGNTLFMSSIMGFSCYEQLFHQSGPARRESHGLASL